MSGRYGLERTVAIGVLLVALIAASGASAQVGIDKIEIVDGRIVVHPSAEGMDAEPGLAPPVAGELRNPFAKKLVDRGFYDPVLDGGELDADRMELIVRTAYATLADYTAAAGTAVSFQLSGFRTYAPEELDTVPYLDLVTLTEGRVLNVFRQSLTRRSPDGVRQASAYPAQWGDAESSWRSSDAGLALVGETLGEVLRQGGQEDPRLLAVEAVTSFEVTATLAGETRSYRAAFVWVPAGRGSEMTFWIVDAITQGVEEAMREPLPVAGEGFATQPPEPPGLPTKGYGTCTVRSVSNRIWSPHLPDPLATGHNSGNHYLETSFSYSCSCDSTCRQTCLPLVESMACGEFGDTGFYCHNRAGNTATTADSVFDGSVSPAQCAAAAGCAVKRCLGSCLCGSPSISIGVSKYGSVSVSVSPDAIWNTNYAQNWQCAPCDPVPPGGGGDCTQIDEQIEPGDEEGCTGGGGGGGSGGGGDPGGGGGSGGGATETCVDVFDGISGEQLGTCCGTTTAEIVSCAEGYL